MIDISIIVPNYNSEQYIERCLFSLVNQKYEKNKYEIIIIDDCSTDNSREIINAFCKKFNNIKKIFLKKNSGVSFCRNIGIKKSKGTYIMFSDSDDYYELNTLISFMDVVRKTNSDFITANYYISNDKQDIKVNCSNNYINQIITKREIISYLSITSCSKLIKKSLFTEKNIYYSINYKRSEELCVIPVLAYYAKKPIYIKNYLYHYYQRKNSASNSKITDYSYFDKSIEDLKLKIDYVKYYDEFEFRAIEQLLYGKTLVLLKNNVDFKKIKNEIADFELKYKNFRKNKYLKKYNIIKRIYIVTLNKNILIFHKLFSIIHKIITG